MDMLLLHDARMIVRDFVKVREGERVAIYTDARRRHEAGALALAAEESGADVITLDIGHQISALLNSGRFFVEPPRHMLAAMEASNINIFAVDETYAFRLDHKVNDLLEAGPERSFFAIDPGMGSWNYSAEDVARADATCDKLLAAMEGADRVRVTSAKGTDLTLSIKGRECLYIKAVPWRGGPGCYPIPLWGELNWAPIEDQTNGTVVVDGISEATTLLKDVAEPVTWTVENGRVVDVAGGTDAEEFRELFTIDHNACVIGEIGIGTNHKALLATQSEKALAGAVHFGLGDNRIYPGGTITSEAHVDGGVRDATVEVDGRVIMRDGQVVI